MKFTFAACLTALVALASAQTPANTAQPPSGNAIGHPELGELIPAGQSFTITWAPDTGDRVTLLLLQGPSSNAVAILTIVENIPNTGSYIWASVPTTLEPAATGYGIQLIVEGSGAYQFSPQCGVRNDAFTGAAITPTPSSTASLLSGSSSTPAAASSTGAAAGVTSSTLSFITYASGAAAASAAGTGGGANFSVPVLSPTSSMSVPATLQSTFSNTATRAASSTAAEPAVSATATGAASRNWAAGGGSLALALLGAMAGF